MAVEVIMPKVDMVMETGTFVEWLKEEGAYVEKGEPLFVISTEKAAMEIEAPASGYLTSFQAKPSDEIPVTTVIAYISESNGAPIAVKELVRSNDSQPEKTPVLTAKPVPAKTQATEPEHAHKVRVTPVARRMAAELGINLQTVIGKGPRGRIHKADVQLAAQQSGQEKSPALTSPIPTATVKPRETTVTQILLPDARQKQVLPLAGPRRIIAERMQYSASMAPHISLTIMVDMSEASAWRGKVSDYIEKSTGYRLSYTSIIARTVASALAAHPFLNASLSGDKIILWEDIHLGIAMNVEDYLIVPVLREAQDKNLKHIVASIGDLLDRARSKKLFPSEMSGSTFTISNLGMFGIETFTAIINPPEAAILAVGKIEEKQVMTQNGPSFRPIMNLTLSADHRIVDGVAAARFLEECKGTLENPYLLI
jgi:pyruvate dehydrogenase E2 component (dihydrolipoamide acetyltransferase)